MAGSFAQGYVPVPPWGHYGNYQWQNNQYGLDRDTYMQDGEPDQVFAFQPSPFTVNTKPITPYEGPSLEDHQNQYANAIPQWGYGSTTYNNNQNNQNNQRGLNPLNTGYQAPAFNSNYSPTPFGGDSESLSSSPPRLIPSNVRPKIRQTSTGHERKHSSGCEGSDTSSAKSVEFINFDVEKSRGLGSRADPTSLQEFSPRSKGSKHQPQQFTKNSNLLDSSNRINKKKSKGDTLKSSFQVQPAKYFEYGKVLRVLWTEPGGKLTELNKEGMTEVRYGQLAHSSPRRMVVIGVRGLYCLCLPIGTYNKRGDQKPSIDLATHTIIHEAGKAPPVDDEARKLMKEPIAVILEKKAVLDPDSMLDFGMIHSVHRNIRVEPVGELTEESKRLVGQYLREVVDRGIPDRYRCI